MPSTLAIKHVDNDYAGPFGCFVRSSERPDTPSPRLRRPLCPSSAGGRHPRPIRASPARRVARDRRLGRCVSKRARTVCPTALAAPVGDCINILSVQRKTIGAPKRGTETGRSVVVPPRASHRWHTVHRRPRRRPWHDHPSCRHPPRKLTGITNDTTGTRARIAARPALSVVRQQHANAFGIQLCFHLPPAVRVTTPTDELSCRAWWFRSSHIRRWLR